jgi:hypothetical protein
VAEPDPAKSGQLVLDFLPQLIQQVGRDVNRLETVAACYGGEIAGSGGFKAGGCCEHDKGGFTESELVAVGCEQAPVLPGL